MNKKQFVKTLNQLKRTYNKLDKKIYKNKPIINIDYFFEVGYVMEPIILRLLSISSGISEDAISWFIYDNNFGENKLSCVSRDGDTEMRIENASDLWDFEKVLA